MFVSWCFEPSQAQRIPSRLNNQVFVSWCFEPSQAQRIPSRLNNQDVLATFKQKKPSRFESSVWQHQTEVDIPVTTHKQQLGRTQDTGSIPASSLTLCTRQQVVRKFPPTNPLLPPPFAPSPFLPPETCLGTCRCYAKSP